MTLNEAIRWATERLNKAGIEEARLEAEFLVAAAVDIPRLRLTLETSKTLKPEYEKQLTYWIQERLTRKPLAYVLGEQPFMNLSLEVNPSVLVPRPETELLVEMAQELLEKRSNAVVVDVGTGSGNIALSLAPHPHVAQLYAIDISKEALVVARRNAMRNRIKQPIHWLHGDLLNPLIDRQLKVDLIIANLPYVSREELHDLSPEVRWEPALALDGGREGVAYLFSLIDQAESVLSSQGVLLLEIGWNQDQKVTEFLAARNIWKKPCVSRDLAGHPRIVCVDKGVLVESINH